MTANPYLSGLNRKQMAYVNGSKLMLYIPGYDPIETTEAIFTTPPKHRVESMTYYYRRGQKYFFRGSAGKVIMHDPVFDANVRLKRGETYQLKMSYI